MLIASGWTFQRFCHTTHRGMDEGGKRSPLIVFEVWILAGAELC